jgi:ribonuclease HI
MAGKFYVVWKGRTPGIYTDWNACNAQVHGFPGPKFKSFKTREEAEAAYAGGSASKGASTAPRRRSSGTSARRGGVKTWTAEEVDALDVDTKIFCDGACDPNPGRAGSGIAVYRNSIVEELWYGLYDPRGTNNTAELHALHHALMIAKDETAQGRSAAVLSDSSYSIQCVTQWASNWKKAGWKKKGGEIRNLDIIKPAHELWCSLDGAVEVLHVNGHAGLEGNELADRMSMHAVEAREGELCRWRDEIDIQHMLSWRAG